jgi:UDP-N-acetylglucosamine/UDP-N-acetylgalactosamine diphosphorylase
MSSDVSDAGSQGSFGKFERTPYNPQTSPEIFGTYRHSGAKALIFILKTARIEMPTVPRDVVDTLEQFNQQHVLKWWQELTTEQQQILTAQIRSIDLQTVYDVWQKSHKPSSAETRDARSRAELAKAPQAVVLQPNCADDHAARRQKIELGEQLLSESKVAVITVAGGQGSRLGFDHPKGMFPIGPVTDRTLFRIFAEQIIARQQRSGGQISWLIMTSAATHDETTAFFQQTQFFGLNSDNIFFFSQGSMPAVDAETGKLLLSDRGTLCLSPDGHGGLVTALKSSGLLDRMAQQGVEHFFYHQVDNPTVIICDPALLGVHARQESELTTSVVRKVSASEKMGVLVDIDGHLEIIEYSQLNEEQASRHDESGQWIFWAGNTAVHVFSRTFLEQLVVDGCQLELHVALKRVAHLDQNGDLVEPRHANANKFERFIFDALPLATRSLIVEGDREREFNPVKNADGPDSPGTARAALNRIGRQWLADAGYEFNASTNVEISPLLALDAEELSARLKSGAILISDIAQS